VEVLVGVVEKSFKVIRSVGPGGGYEDVVSKDSRYRPLCMYIFSPWCHEECDEHHGEGATLGNGGGFGVGGAEGVSYLVVGEGIFMVRAVGVEDWKRHSGSLGEGIKEPPVDLVEALHDVDRPSDERDPFEHVQLEEEGGVVPPVSTT
jgi:hypothetical protein